MAAVLDAPPPAVTTLTDLRARFRDGKAALLARFLEARPSAPVSVTSTVWSHCADSERSFVTMVQPSPISRISRRPALIIGSIVNIIPGTSSSSVPGRP